MIDSINYIIRDIKELDFKHIRKLGMFLKHFIKKNPNTGYENSCYEFKYKEVEFKYNSNLNLLTIITNTHKILNKKDITLSDKTEYETRINRIVSEVLNTNNFKLELNRIDYCVDLKLNNLISVYLLLLKWNKNKYKYMTIKEEYATSLHINNKRGKTNINIYNRYAKTKQEENQGIMRFEVQCKKKLIKTEYDKYGIDKELSNYWSKESMQEYFFDFLYGYLYEGDYYKYTWSRKMIKDSTCTPKTKIKLRKFLRDVSKESLAGLIEKNKYPPNVIQNRIDKLNELNINPISIPEGYKYEKLDSLYKLLQAKAEQDYFI